MIDAIPTIQEQVRRTTIKLTGSETISDAILRHDAEILALAEQSAEAMAILRRVAALLDAVDRHPIARRWLGLP